MKGDFGVDEFDVEIGDWDVSGSCSDDRVEPNAEGIRIKTPSTPDQFP